MPLETRITTSEPFSSAPLLAELSCFHSCFSFCLLFLSPAGRQDKIPAKHSRTPGPHVFIKKVSWELQLLFELTASSWSLHLWIKGAETNWKLWYNKDYDRSCTLPEARDTAGLAVQATRGCSHTLTAETLAFPCEALPNSVSYSSVWKTKECDLFIILACTSRASIAYFSREVFAFFPGRWKEISFRHQTEFAMEDEQGLLLTICSLPGFSVSLSPEPDKLVYLRPHVRQTSKSSPKRI